MKQTFNELPRIFRMMGKDSDALNEISKYHGVGTDRFNATYGAVNITDDHNIGEMSSASTGFVKGINRVGEISRDATLFNIPMIPMSDMLKRVNFAINRQRLAEIVLGLRDEAPSYLKKIGLTPKDVTMLKKKMNLNDAKQLKNIGLDKWSKADRDNLLRIEDNMLLAEIQSNTYGGQPAWTRNSALGQLLSVLLRFPIQAITNHGGRDIMTIRDGNYFSGASRTMVWYAGGLTSIYLRDFLANRETEFDDAAKRAFFQLPIAAILTVPESITNPAVLSKTNDIVGIQDALR